MVILSVDDWPLLTVTFEGASGEKDVATYLKQHLRYLKKKQPYAALIDLAKAEKMPEEQRRMHKEWMAKHRELLTEYCRGAALILPPLPMRLAIKAYLKAKPLPFPTDVFGSHKDARAWIAKRLA